MNIISVFPCLAVFQWGNIKGPDINYFNLKRSQVCVVTNINSLLSSGQSGEGSHSSSDDVTNLRPEWYHCFLCIITHEHQYFLFLLYFNGARINSMMLSISVESQFSWAKVCLEICHFEVAGNFVTNYSHSSSDDVTNPSPEWYHCFFCVYEHQYFLFLLYFNEARINSTMLSISVESHDQVSWAKVCLVMSLWSCWQFCHWLLLFYGLNKNFNIHVPYLYGFLLVSSFHIFNNLVCFCF